MQRSQNRTPNHPPLNPLVSHCYTADPSAHVFDGRLYLYPSHDIESDIPEDDLGSHFAMRDYPVFSMDAIGGTVTDHGVALDLKQIPWADRQLWAPDDTRKGGSYYFFFPAKDREGVFRIGVATLSGGQTHLRCVKVRQLRYRPDGSITSS